LNYQQLKIAQDKDKTIQKILKMPNTLYMFARTSMGHGGGKITSLICFKEKIVIPGLLQKHVINWYHTTLCHPGINQTEERPLDNTYMVAKNAITYNKLCADLPSLSAKQEVTKEVWITPT
jgi:hypothetical protein